MTSTIITKTYTTATTATEASTTAAFVFREDGWFNMTKAAKAFNRRLDKFWESQETKDYLFALSNTLKTGELNETKRGGQGGTWAHPKLAVFFARWLDTKFSVWCDAVIDDILRGNQELKMVNKAESAVEALPADVKAAGAAWQAEMQQAMASLQKTVEAQSTALTAAQEMIASFMLKQKVTEPNAVYMTVTDYLRLTGNTNADIQPNPQEPIRELLSGFLGWNRYP